MRQPRDSQRSRVYKAEAFLETISKRHDSMEELTAYVRRVRTNKRVLSYARELRGPMVIRDWRGARSAKGGADGILMPVWSRYDAVILHELAHVVISRRHRGTVATHGWEFAQLFLRLVRTCMGKEAHHLLRLSFKSRGVRYTPKRKRKPLAPEAKAKLVARLELARAAKKKPGASPG